MGNWKLGPTINVSQLWLNYTDAFGKANHAPQLAMKPPSLDGHSEWTQSRTLRDAVRVTLNRIQVVRDGRRRAYVLHCTTAAGEKIQTWRFYGINAIHTMVER